MGNTPAPNALAQLPHIQPAATPATGCQAMDSAEPDCKTDRCQAKLPVQALLVNFPNLRRPLRSCHAALIAMLLLVMTQ